MNAAEPMRMPRGWKRVPIPEAIASLEREPKRGFPIPYVAEREHVEERNLVEDASGRFAVSGCSCTIEHGTPADLGAQCPVRQRECMEHRICQVCAKPIPEDEDCVFLGRGDLSRYVEPPLHTACAAYALQVCPGIARRPHVGAAICRRYHVLVEWKFSLDDRDSTFLPIGHKPVELAWRKAVVSFYVGRPIYARRMTPEDFVAEYGATPIHEG